MQYSEDTTSARGWRALACLLLCILLWQLSWLPGPPPAAEDLWLEETMEETQPPGPQQARLSHPSPGSAEGKRADQPAPAPLRYVGNTGGEGVYLRATPRMDDRLRAWVDGTRMQPTGIEVEVEGQHWLQVHDPEGTLGWVPARYLTE